MGSIRALQQASQPSQPTNHTTQQASRELPKKSYLHQGEGEGYKVGFRPTFKKVLVLVQHNTSIPEPHALGRCLKGKSVLEDKRLPMVRAWKSRTASLACCRTACPQCQCQCQCQGKCVQCMRCVALPLRPQRVIKKPTTAAAAAAAAATTAVTSELLAAPFLTLLCFFTFELPAKCRRIYPTWPLLC